MSLHIGSATDEDKVRHKTDEICYVWNSTFIGGQPACMGGMRHKNTANLASTRRRGKHAAQVGERHLLGDEHAGALSFRGSNG